MSDKILCIYHGNCADGFGAAWVVRRKFPHAEFHAGVYGQSPPDVIGKDVVLVDFSYKAVVLEEMRKGASSIIVLDHHKTAEEDLKNAKQFSKTWERHMENVYQDRCENADINGAILYALFDMGRSGAMIAWDFFFSHEEPPQLIKHIQDRDLWKFKLEGTREIQAAVFSFPYDFIEWDHLMDMSTDELYEQGHAIERKHHKDIEELIEVTKRRMILGGHWVWVANLPYTMTSDAGHKMCKMPLGPNPEGEINDPLTPFAACYWDTPEGRVFSLRSVGDFDVSEIAVKYGGGGHKNAAGFQMAIGWEGEEK